MPIKVPRKNRHFLIHFGRGESGDLTTILVTCVWKCWKCEWLQKKAQFINTYEWQSATFLRKSATIGSIQWCLMTNVLDRLMCVSCTWWKLATDWSCSQSNSAKSDTNSSLEETAENIVSRDNYLKQHRNFSEVQSMSQEFAFRIPSVCAVEDCRKYHNYWNLEAQNPRVDYGRVADHKMTMIQNGSSQKS